MSETVFIQEALRGVEEVKMLTDDDFEGLEAKDLSTDHLNQLVKEAERLKILAQNSVLSLRNSDETVFPSQSRNEVNKAKRTLVSFIRSASKEIKCRETTATENPSLAGITRFSNLGRSETAKLFKTDRIRSYGNDAIESLKGLVGELMEIGSSKVDTDYEFRILQERFNNAVKRSTH